MTIAPYPQDQIDRITDSFYLAFRQAVKSKSGNWYRNVQLLGVGGNAVTFLVLATSGDFKGTLFALKVYRRISDERRQEKFLNEFDFLISRSHPSIMRVYDSGVFRLSALGQRLEYPFVVAEYLPFSLADVMKEKRATVVEKASYALQLISALAFLSAKTPAIVHRDIKPQNIFIKGRSCVLGDFGLMKILDESDEADRNTMKASVTPGMPYFYRTPDLIAYCRGETPITTKSDVFQLGLVLCELFTGRNPAKPPKSIEDMLDPLELSPIGQIPCVLGGSIATLLKRMLQFVPSMRHDATKLLDPWNGVFDDLVSRYKDLEGKAF